MTPVTLLGLPAGQLAMVLGVSAALITLLYVLKQQRRRVEVPFARLWQQVLSQTQASSFWRKLRRWLSLLLQLCVLALLVAALGDPRLGRTAAGRSLVLIVDASASMQAVVAGAGGAAGPPPTRLALAKQRARELIAGLSGDDLAVVVALDGQPAPQGGLSFDARELYAQVDAVTARDTPADLPAALALAGALLHGREHPTVVLISDGGFDDSALAAIPAGAGPGSGPGPGLDVRFQPLLSKAVKAPPIGNAAITAFSVRRYRRNRLSYEVLISLGWFPAVGGPAGPQRVTLELVQEGEVVDVQPLELAAGVQEARLYPNLSGAGTHLEARLRLSDGSSDALALDDRAYAVLPERQRQRVLIVTRGNLFLEGALLAAGAGEENHLVIDKVTPAAYTSERAGHYDVVLFDSFTPPTAPDANAIYLDPQRDGPFDIAGEVKRPLITDLEASHPVLRWVSLGDVNMTRSSVFRLGPGDRALASMLKQPLIVAREQTGRSGATQRSVAIGFDLRQSDLPLRVAFPVLLMNAMDWFAGDVDADLGSYRTGRTWRVPLRTSRRSGTRGTSDAEALALTTAQLMLPEGEIIPVPVHEGHALYYGQRVGFYSLRTGGLAAPLLWAANLADVTESTAALRSTLQLGGTTLRPPDGGQRALRRELWPYLLLLALTILALEWWSYHRRWTV
jgi:hypothetical protein